MSVACVIAKWRCLPCVVFFGLITLNQAFMRSITLPFYSCTGTDLYMTSTNQVPVSSSGIYRGHVKHLSSVTAVISAFTFARNANAGFFQSDEQDQIDQISSFQRPIFELLDQLRPAVVPNTVGVYAQTQVLKGGKEDSDVVLNYLETYIKPCQSKMADAAPKLKLANPVDQARIEVLPLLMKGHILELGQAIKEMKADSQGKEVEEVTETLAEYLKLSSSKYSVTAYVSPRPLTEKDYLGPLGCEFWGKKRIEGSNACANVEESK